MRHPWTNPICANPACANPTLPVQTCAKPCLRKTTSCCKPMVAHKSHIHSRDNLRPDICISIYPHFLYIRHIHTSTHPHIHASTHPHIHPHIHASTHTRINPDTHASAHPHIHTSTHPRIHTSRHPHIRTSTRFHIFYILHILHSTYPRAFHKSTRFHAFTRYG